MLNPMAANSEENAEVIHYLQEDYIAPVHMAQLDKAKAQRINLS